MQDLLEQQGSAKIHRACSVQKRKAGPREAPKR